FKPVPVGIINQVPCMTALELAAEANLEPKDIAAIEIRTARSEANYPGAAARGPFRQISGATMSTIYCVALALSRRQVTLEGFHLFDDPTILSLMERSTLVPSDLPRLSCDIEVTTLDGRTFEKRMRRSREDFACGFDGVKGLMRSLAPEMAISSENLERLIEDVANIESCDRIDSIVELLCERE
ncbi:MAG: hypothetical protein Q7O66_09265, partial [Dehalococcoidia bacterium]|nr:hypothetical protein [Dehalococcoidia bacterium]